VNNFQTFDEEKYEIEEIINPKISATSLSYSDIYRNASTIYRLFESVNFTINTTNVSPYANYVLMQVQFHNNTIRNYNMTSMGNGNFTYEYKPKYNTPTGPQNVSFLIYNNTNDLLNNHTTYTNFTIESNCYVDFKFDNEPIFEYYHINETLIAEVDVHNFKSYEFEWDLTIVDSMDEASQNNLLNLQSNVNYFTLLIDNETFQQVNTIYYLKVNMTDEPNDKKAAAYFPFYVKNSDPIITSKITLSSQEVFREEYLEVSVNITDLETATDDLTVYADLYNSEGNIATSEFMEHNGDNLFTHSFLIPASYPIGRYRVIVNADDEDYGQDKKETYVEVKNKPPEIHSYKINGLSMNESISVFYGGDFVFTFNVSDENGVSAVKVALLNDYGEWFNITREYIGDDTEITIRTQDLSSGIWIVYMYVIDTDGAVTSLIDDYNIAPQGIRIVPDVLSNYIPWIAFFSGISIGLLIGIGIIVLYYKSKFIGRQPIPTDKKTIPSKKAIKKKKVKVEVPDDESKNKETEELKDEKEEEQDMGSTRKIKRKL
ncbi:MAG: hypothetical protein ACFFC3_16520, partial [Candidatus Odinarchaeota archaeon]